MGKTNVTDRPEPTPGHCCAARFFGRRSHERRLNMPYKLEGKLLEVCDCNVLCPCWIGEDPDNGTCQSSLAYHFTEGNIDGVDVSGLTVATTVYIPGNVLDGNWKRAIYIDDRASDEQAAALSAALNGLLGGPLADVAALVGEAVHEQRMPIDFQMEEGKGKYAVGDIVHAEMEPYKGPSGETTKLVESIFSTIPGSPAYVARAAVFELDDPTVGLKLELHGQNAIQGHFLFEA